MYNPLTSTSGYYLIKLAEEKVNLVDIYLYKTNMKDELIINLHSRLHANVR